LKKIVLYGITLVALAAAYLLAWPVPIAPVAWDAPAAPGYTGAHAVNTKLAILQMIDLKGEVGPEHIQFGPDGKLPWNGLRQHRRLLVGGLCAGRACKSRGDASTITIFRSFSG
jgi:hypothetical protein